MMYNHFDYLKAYKPVNLVNIVVTLENIEEMLENMLVMDHVLSIQVMMENNLNIFLSKGIKEILFLRGLDGEYPGLVGEYDGDVGPIQSKHYRRKIDRIRTHYMKDLLENKMGMLNLVLLLVQNKLDLLLDYTMD